MSDKYASVICPFFIDAKGKIITCEILSGRLEARTRFPNRKQAAQWMEKYCKTFQYGDCEIAERILQRHE